MCNPVLAVAAAAMVAGSMMKMSAAAGAKKEELGAVDAERARQQAFATQGGQQLEATRAATNRPAYDDAEAANVAKRTEAYQGATPAYEPSRDLLAGQSSAPAIVSGLIGGRVGDAVARMNVEAANRANLNAYGDTKFGFDQAITRGQQQQAQYSNFARGSSSILPTERAAAQSHAASPVGDLLVGIGQVGMMAGGGIAGAAGGAGAGAGAGAASSSMLPAWATTPFFSSAAGAGAGAAAGAVGHGAAGAAAAAPYYAY